MAIVPHRNEGAGLLLYRRPATALEVLLVRPGGPWWRNRDKGAWQIPKGRIEPGEDAMAAAFREVGEELGLTLGRNVTPLGEIHQAGGKRVIAWALEQDVDPTGICSNRFALEWPPKSGKIQSVPEIEAARWFTPSEARDMILPSQRALLDAFEGSRAGEN